MKKKGFTLVELLAVIVILSIIALIATPIILNIINNARKSAAMDSTYGYVKAIENQTALSALSNKKYEDKEDYTYDEIKVNLKGIKPTGGIYSLKNGVVIKGVFCINGYISNYENGEVEVTGKGCKSGDLKLNGELKLSSSRKNYIYPNNGTFEVTKNISGGNLSCTSSDTSVATCNINGTTVTVVPGVKEGSATITVTSEETSKYKEAKAAHVAITAKGTLASYTANDYEGIYDDKEHSITVTSSNSIIKYGEEEGNYQLNKPTYKDVGEYTVYFEITQAGYNTVTGSRKVIITQADGNIELETNKGTIAYNEEREIEITKNISNGNLEVKSENANIVEAKIIDGKLAIKGKELGSTKVIVTSKETKNYKSSNTEYEVTVGKANNTLKLSSSSGNYTYPTEGTFEVTENKSGGTLKCISNDKNIATCSVEGNKITVKPGTTEGSTTLTIKSEATENYNEGQAAYVVITAKGTLNNITATGYENTYDGDAHSITVTSSGATITYKTSENGTYDSTNPTYRDVGTYTVYYKVERSGYNTVTGSKKVIITKAHGSINAPTTKTLIYNEGEQELVNRGSSSTGTIQYKLDNGLYSTNIPKAKDVGVYTVYYKVVGDKNHEDVAESSIDVTISKADLSYTSSGYNEIYDGKSHSITVISNGNIKYGTSIGTYDKNESPKYSDVGTYIVYYEITKDGYNTVKGSESVVITKADNKLTLSENTGNYTYPTEGTFTVTENISGGTLKCIPDDKNIATCSVEGNKITVKPGTTEGSTTLTIKSEATTNYNEGQAAYLAITQSGTLSVTAIGYSGAEDGASHGITVTSSGATIKYAKGIGLNNSDIIQNDYTIITGGTYTFNNETSGNVLNSFQIQIWDDNGTWLKNISDFNTVGQNKSLYVHDYNTGLYKIRVKANGSTMDSAVIYDKIYMEKGEKYNISYAVTKLESKQVVAKDIEIYTNYNLDSSPTYKNIGTYPVYYQVSRPGYKTVTGHKNVIITKEVVVAPTRSKTTSNSTSITAVYNTGSATSGIDSTNCYRTDSSGEVLANGILSGNNCVFSGLSSNTTYYYKKCITSKVGNTSCSSASSILTAGEVTNLAHKKEVQKFPAPCTGEYKLEVWGAEGASDSDKYHGGYGGYSKGTYSLQKGKNLYIFVGGKGVNINTSNQLGTVFGYPNGGSVSVYGNDTNAITFSSGGGSTHILLENKDLKDTSISNVVIVAAGGGGACDWWGNGDNGGSGGGYIGGTTTKNFANAGVANNNPTGGTQTSGGLGGGNLDGISANSRNQGIYGVGGGSTVGSPNTSGGGGGGLYGGGASWGGSGAGGSSYIGNTSLTDKSMYCYNCTESNEESTKTISTTHTSTNPTANYAKEGNGYAKITVLSCSN